MILTEPTKFGVPAILPEFDWQPEPEPHEPHSPLTFQGGPYCGALIKGPARAGLLLPSPTLDDRKHIYKLLEHRCDAIGTRTLSVYKHAGIRQ